MHAEAAPTAGVLDGSGSKAYFSTGRHLHGRPVVAIYTPDGGAVRAGSFLYVEPDVELLIGGNHRIDWVTTFPVREVFDLPGARIGIPWSKGDIVIGHGVRLRRGARVMSGVKIGDGAEVAESSVVTHDVAPYSVAAGNPARQVGLRFAPHIVSRLTATSWWDWYDDMTVWRLDHLTGGQAHVLVPQLGREGPLSRRAPVRRAAAHLLRGLARRVDVTASVDPVEASAGSGTATNVEGAGAFGDLNLVAEASAPPVPMGRASYGWPTVRGAPERVTIGSYCSIASGSTIDVEDAGVRVGNDVWVGRQATILPGVSIGDGAVIAAYSIVGENVRPYAVVAGNPAREVKRRFDDATVEALLRIRWWEWTEATVQERAEQLCSDDVATFLARYDTQPTASEAVTV